MIRILAGEIVLRDEGSKTSGTVDLGAFEMAPHLVTRDLYDAVRGEASVSSAGPPTPVTEVSWREAVRFGNLLSRATGLKPCYSWARTSTGRTWSATGMPGATRPSASRTLGSGSPIPLGGRAPVKAQVGWASADIAVIALGDEAMCPKATFHVRSKFDGHHLHRYLDGPTARTTGDRDNWGEVLELAADSHHH